MGESNLYYDVMKERNFDVYTSKHMSYPHSDLFDYYTSLETINFDRERIDDIKRNKAFIIGPTEEIKKDIKSDTSIFSSRFGASLKDMNPYIDRYRCLCGKLRSTINEGEVCPRCGTKVKFVDDDFSYGAYIVLKDYYVIHPNLYKKLQKFIGSDLDEIIKPFEDKDIDGHVIKRKKSKSSKASPYYGLGMIDFKEHFDEIMQYYFVKNKEELFNDIMKNRDAVFTQSIWVYTTYLRPVDPNATQLSYESTNSYYYIISTLVTKVNDTHLDIRRNKKNKNDLLYDIQCKYNDLYDSIIKILSTKSGNFRTVFGGRANFSGRNVIRQNVVLDIDQITLSYYSLVELLQQRIINILKTVYNYSYSEAYMVWWNANLNIDQKVVNIINSLITGSYRKLGLPVLVNRNPTIAYGGILQMFVVGMTFDHSMCVPLRILKLFKGDFDGDVTNIFLIINKEFLELSFRIFNPRNAMMISSNDGKFNSNTENQRDTIINANTLMRLCRHKYSQEQLNMINGIKDRLV